MVFTDIYSAAVLGLASPHGFSSFSSALHELDSGPKFALGPPLIQDPWMFALGGLLIGGIPIFLFLRGVLAGSMRVAGSDLPYDSIEAALSDHRARNGESLYELSFRTPLLLVFLRHAGCTFCREAMGDLSKAKEQIKGTGTELVLVQMGSVREGRQLAARFGLDEAQVISDPSRRLYQTFELKRGSFKQLFGLKVWLRGFWVAIVRGFGFGRIRQDSRQMPGTFLIREGQIVREFRHETPADRPDYVALASCAAEEPSAGSAVEINTTTQ